MKYDSLLSRSELFLITAAIAAHASAQGESFRQRDVKFLVELFSNWVSNTSRESTLTIQNTQISRFIEHLQNEGFARRISRRGRPTYRLTRVGLVELLTKVVERDYIDSRPHFFFLYYFIKNYRPRLEKLVASEGNLFPAALKIELDNLLNTHALVLRERKAAKQELERQKIRIKDSKATARHIQSGLKNEIDFGILIEEVEKLYPYELNSQKPLHELMASIPDDQQKWELVTGNLMRAEQIWDPMKNMLSTYIAQLDRLMAAEQ